MSRCCLLTALGFLALAAPLRGEETGTAGKTSVKFTLQYKFRAGETVAWEVGHQARIRSTAGGTTQLVETASDSTKVWRVSAVNEKGEITFVHSVERVQMRHKTTGREETVVEVPLPDGKQLPFGYEQMAEDVGVPLSRIVMDSTGRLIQREDLRKNPRPTVSGYEGPLTIPLPDHPVAVGESWANQHVVSAPRKDGTFKRVKLEQRFTLKDVRLDTATIFVESIVLTPVDEPAVQVHLVQSKTKGTITFDIAQGRVVAQKLTLDEEIIGVPLGEASSMHYVMSFTEKLVPAYAGAARTRTGAKTK